MRQRIRVVDSTEPKIRLTPSTEPRISIEEVAAALGAEPVGPASPFPGADICGRSCPSRCPNYRTTVGCSAS